MPPISKIYEKLLQKQINNYIENILSPYVCGYTEGYYPACSDMSDWKVEKDFRRKSFLWTVLMDLSKAFDTIKYGLLIAKPHAHGFEKSALKLLLNYLSNRWQRTKINKKFS